MKECTIRRANASDEIGIMEFIKKYWDADHILANSKIMFEYQHFYNNELSYVIAENTDTKQIEGILGYIIYSEEESRDAFGVMWKVRNSNYPMLGLKIQKFALEELNVDNFFGIGLTQPTLIMHKRLGMVIDKMKHYYMLGYESDYHVAKITEDKRKNYDTTIEQFELIETDSFESVSDILEASPVRIPRKSARFIKHRYYKHPVYQYKKYEIRNLTSVLGMFIARDISCNDVKILRIVDYIGDIKWIKHTGKAWEMLLKSEKYEYVDFYQSGIDDEIMDATGFVLRDMEDPNIIPNYFEPYVECNIDLDFFTSSKDPVVLFKGDGDQDRPRYLNL